MIDGDTCRAAADGETSDAEVTAGPGSEGGFVRCILDPDRTPVGPSVAPRVGAVLAWADRAFGLDLGALTPAPDLFAAAPAAAPAEAPGVADAGAPVTPTALREESARGRT